MLCLPCTNNGYRTLPTYSQCQLLQYGFSLMLLDPLLILLQGLPGKLSFLFKICTDAGQLTRRPKIIFGSSMCVDGRLDANTAFRAEALGCLIIPIIICLAKEFIQQTESLGVRHTCDKEGLVNQLSRLYKQEQYHTIPDTADNDFTIPTAHWARRTAVD